MSAANQTKQVLQPDLWGVLANGGTAVYSSDGLYRYYLTRELAGSGPPVHFAMLNPSVAGADEDDPTVRRCLAFAQRWDASSLHVWNLFARTSTKPSLLPRDATAIGDRNLSTITDALISARSSRALVIAAWGAHRHPLKAAQVDFVTVRAATCGVVVKALHVTQAGDPGHPLFLRGDLEPRGWPGTLKVTR